MNTSIKNPFLLVILGMILFLTLSLSAQEKIKGLIISEVYLDKGQPAKNWIEIYNPTDKAQVLERFRVSHIRAIDVLPPAIRKAGGITIEPGEYLVICADKGVFQATWNQIEPVVVEALANLAEGGFITTATKGVAETRSDGVRYGHPAASSHVKDHFGNQVLNFLTSGKSYSRKIIKSAEGESLSDFYESEPTPGLPNK